MKLETRIRIGSNMRALRIIQGMGKAEMAKIAGVGQSTYASYEMGKSVQDVESLYKIATATGIDMSAFLTYEPERFISYIAGGAADEETAVELLSIYRNLSPFSKGMLLEKAYALKEKEKERESHSRPLIRLKD